MANDYYTFKNGHLWLHHDETVDRNTFYTDFESSSVEVVLNDAPSSIKDFHTLNYEGSQSKIEKFIKKEIESDGFQPTTIYSDQETYNLTEKKGWYVDKIYTDKEEGSVKEFIEKEGKWFNNINKLTDIGLSQADTADFTFQGIGDIGEVYSDGTVLGCMDPLSINYNPLATVDNGSCYYVAPCDCTNTMASMVINSAGDAITWSINLPTGFGMWKIQQKVLALGYGTPYQIGNNIPESGTINVALLNPIYTVNNTVIFVASWHCILSVNEWSCEQEFIINLPPPSDSLPFNPNDTNVNNTPDGDDEVSGGEDPVIEQNGGEEELPPPEEEGERGREGEGRDY